MTLVLLALLSVLCFASSPVPAQGPGPLPYRADQVLVAFREDVPPAARASVLGQVGLTAGPAGRAGGVKLSPQARAAGLDVPAALEALRRHPAVRVAEPDYSIRTEAVPDDPDFPAQYNLQNTGQSGGLRGADVDVVRAWDITTGRAGVVVAVIDSGVDYRHPDLRDNILRTPSGDLVGYDWVNDDPDPMDDNGHGTHVSGIIGARGNNHLGVAGVCWNVRLMPLKITDASGNGSVSDAIAAIDFAVASGAKIINASFGGPGQSQLFLEAVQRARDAGVLLVAAAGNLAQNSDFLPQYPAGYSILSNNVLAVAASDDRDRLAGFSNFGPVSVDLAAPGDRVLSTALGGTYSVHNGTSMAAPHVSGAAALLLAHDPALTLEKLKDRLVASTDARPALQGKVRTGGRLNIRQALQGGDEAPGSQISLFLSPTSVVGGTPVGATVTINGEAPPGGFPITLSSASPMLATAPDAVTIPAGASSRSFTVTTSPTAASTLVELTASSGSVSGRGSIVVLAPSPALLKVEPAVLALGEGAVGKVRLTGPAPAGGSVVTLSAAPRQVSLPAQVRIPAGATEAEFALTAGKPKQPAVVTVTANMKGFAAAAAVSVLPPMLRALKLKPARVKRGGSSRATLTLLHPAPKGGLPIAMKSSLPGAVVPTSVTVPAGARSVRFRVGARAAAPGSAARITATCARQRKKAVLRIRR